MKDNTLKQMTEVQAPVTEPQRQFYYMEKAKEYVKNLTEELGRTPKACVTTFGYQMNPAKKTAQTRIK